MDTQATPYRSQSPNKAFKDEVSEPADVKVYSRSSVTPPEAPALAQGSHFPGTPFLPLAGYHWPFPHPPLPSRTGSASLETISQRLRLSKEQQQQQHQQQQLLQLLQLRNLQQQQERQQLQLKSNGRGHIIPKSPSASSSARNLAQPRRSQADPYEHQRSNANFTSPKVKTVMDLPSSSNVVEIGLPESSRSHLFRHASEITRETKGGYLQGRLYIPEVNRPAYMRLSLVPAEICTEHNPFHLHPNLLHINMKTNKKKRNIRDGELPDDVDWCFIFKIEHDDVLRVCPPQNPRHKEPRFHLNPANEQVSNAPDNLAHEEVLKRQSKDKFQATIKKAKGGKVPSQTKADDMYLGPMKLPTEHITTRVATVKDNYIEMGNAGLMLNIITPLQKFSKGGTNLSEVIRQRYFDLNVNGDPLSSKSLTQVEDYYVKKKEDRIKLQQVRLLIELFSVEDGFPFITSASSDIITNSKSKECGPLQLHDINPAISCCECETKVFMLSFFKLVSGIRANFILYNPEKQSVCYDEHDELFKKLVQPPAKDCQVFNQCVVTCKVPKQDYRVIEEIERHGLQLRLTAFRPSDRKMSNTSFNFKYLKHGHYAPGEPAILDTCEGVCKHFDQHKEVSQELPIAKPGVIRRHPTNQLVPNEVLNQSNELHDQLEEEEKSGDLEIDTEPYPHPYTIPTIIQHHTRPEVLPRPFASHVPKKRPYHEPRAVEEGFYRVNDVVDMKVEQNQILAHAASDNLVLPVPLKKMFMAKAHQGTAISVKEEGNEEEDYDSPVVTF